MGDYQKALDYYIKSYKVMLNVLGENHPSTKTVYNNMAICYKESGGDMDGFEEWVKGKLDKLKQEHKKR